MPRAVIPEILLSIHNSMNTLNRAAYRSKISAFYTQMIKKDLFLSYQSPN